MQVQSTSVSATAWCYIPVLAKLADVYGCIVPCIACDPVCYRTLAGGMDHLQKP